MSEIVKELRARTYAAKEAQSKLFWEDVKSQIEAAYDACRKAADEGKTDTLFACQRTPGMVKTVVAELRKQGFYCEATTQLSGFGYLLIAISWDTEATREAQARYAETTEMESETTAC